MRPWNDSTLGEVLTVIRGVSYKKEQASRQPAKGYLPVLRATNIQDRLTFDELVYVPRANVSPEQLLRKNDIVIAASSGSRAIVGKAAQLNQDWEGSFGAFCFGLRPIESVSPRFVGWFLQTREYRNRVSELAAGVNINNLRTKHIEETPIRLPPLDEQERIVAEIEKQFTRLDAGVASLKRVQTALKRYRASVLKAACEGRLVPTEAELARKENRGYETGEQLLQRILKERREKWSGKGKYKEPATPNLVDLAELPEGWIWATVEQLSNVVRGASPRPAGDPKYFGGNISWITVGPITADETAYLKSVRETVTEAGRERSRYIEPHTLLLTNSGATLGVPKISLIGGCINDGVAALLDVNYPLKLYLLYFLRTQTKSLRGVNQGAAQPNLNTTIIKAITVPLPPRAEEQRIVAEIERRLSMIAELETMTSTELRRAIRLRQSILQRAFSGRLATTVGTGSL